MTTVISQVTASTDDCSRLLTTSSWGLAYEVCYAGRSSEVTWYMYGSGMRFTNITIPQGATINSALLELVAKFASTGETVNTRISAEDIDDAPTFADDAAAFDTRYSTHTAAIVDWDNIGGWSAGDTYDSPEIKTVIQEIVDRAGWASGNDIVIFWEDFDNRSTITSGDPLKEPYSYNGSPTYAPKLVIEYTSTPSVTTQVVTDISGTTATGNGNITSLGYPTPTAHGVCWNTTGTPTTSDDSTDEGAASATGAFTSAMTGLIAGTKYYVRAYATNTVGTEYGSEVNFTTLKAPTVTTQTCEQVYGVTAQGRGNITYIGEPTPTAHGHCWAETADPTTSDNVVDNGAATATGSFSSALTNLIPSTSYYTRAYATNTSGTSYGANVYFVAPTTRAGYYWTEGQHFHLFNENAEEIVLEDMDNARILAYLGM